MKFNIECNEYNNMVKRIAAVICKKSSIPTLWKVLVVADRDQNTVSFYGTDVNNYAQVRSQSAHVEKSGKVLVDLENLEKTTVIKSGDLNIEFDLEAFKIRSSKKSCAVVGRSDEDILNAFPAWPSMEDSDLFCEITGSALLEKMAGINCCLDKVSGNRLLNAYCFDFSSRRIATIDGHRIGVAGLGEECQISDHAEEVKIDFSSYDVLKGIAGKSRDLGEIRIAADHKYARFTGEDFELICRQVEGNYFDIDKLLGAASTYCYHVDSEELGRIAKEYCKILKGTNKPMIIAGIDGRIFTYAGAAEFKTTDLVESGEFDYYQDPEQYAGFNPVFISDACKALAGEIKITGSAAKSPIELTDGEYIFLILPINIGAADMGMSWINAIREQAAA